MTDVVQSVLHTAFQAHQAGDLEAAEQGYRQVLQRDERHPDALNLLGVVRSQRKDHPAAIECLLRAVAAKSGFVDAWLNLAKAFSSARRLPEAVGACDVVLRLEPGHREAMATQARALRKLKDHRGALNAARALLAVDPRSTEMAHMEANCLVELGELDQAHACYVACLARQPDDPALANDHAMLLVQLKREDEALPILERLATAVPPYLPACSNLGNLLHGRGDAVRARALHEQVVTLDPRLYAGWINFANVLQKDGELARARQALETARDLHPGRPEAWVNLAGVLMAQDEEVLALQTLRRAIELDPGSADAWNNLGAMELDCARPHRAQAAYAEAVQVAPGQAAAQFGLALACLMQGDFERGWPLYEWRWLGASQSRPDQRPRFSCPQWQGQTVSASASLVVYHEQGFGDTVQFLRFVPGLAERFAEVVLIVQPGLWALARHHLPARIVVLNSDQGQQAVRERRFDWHCPLGSLPWAFGLRDPDRIPGTAGYVRVPPAWPVPAAFETLRQGARAVSRPVVGLCWAGNPELAHDKSRSLTLASLRDLIAGHDLRWVSLQKQRSQADADLLQVLGVLDLSADLGDFTDTAAVIAGLDLVIAVDTVIAHLAGALGRPCWLLNRHQSEWRWMLGRTDSVWYRSLRQFRQPRRKDWASVLGSVDLALAEAFARRVSSPPALGGAS